MQEKKRPAIKQNELSIEEKRPIPGYYVLFGKSITCNPMIDYSKKAYGKGG